MTMIIKMLSPHIDTRGTVGGKGFNQKKKDRDCGFKYFVK